MSQVINEYGTVQEKKAPVESNEGITLKWKWFDRPIVFQALQKLARHQMSSRANYLAGKIINEINKNMEVARVDCLNLLKKYAVMDTTTQMPKNFPDGPFSFVSREDEERHDAEFLKLMDREFSIKAMKIPLFELDNGGFNPEEVMAIEDILDTDSHTKSRLII